jgi:hypothetical protein
MVDNFDIRMSKKSNEELIAIVTIDRSKYQESAIISAEKEVKKRNINTSFFQQIKVDNEEVFEQDLKQEYLNQIYNFSYNLKNIENKSLDEVKFILTEKGHNENDISWVIRQLLFKEEEKNKANNDMLYGALWCVGGIAATVAEIGYIFWGAILFGAIQFFKGASNVEIFKNK